MLRPSGDAGMPLGGLSAANRLNALLREMREDSAPTVCAYLLAAGFDDIPSSWPLALWATVSAGEPADDLTKIPGRTGKEASGMIATLVQRGYLEFRRGPGSGDRPAIALTGRGETALNVAMNGFKAARWADFPFRPGDIVISTWPKTGTTWVQMICALLVFQTRDLPAPLSELSPWLDLNRISRDEVYSHLAAQEHRRIIKTHLPLNDLPADSRATYITVARHPLDAALSLYYQKNNKVAAPEVAIAPPPELGAPSQRPVSPRESLLHWIDTDPSPQFRYHFLAEMLRHLSAAWALRSEPNVVLVHYEDLSADLEGEMRRIAARLGIVVPGAIWPGLVEAATFEHMRATPDRFLTSGLILKDNAAFFRRGTSGEGRELLTAAELARYHARAGTLAPADLLAWLHRRDKPMPAHSASP